MTWSNNSTFTGLTNGLYQIKARNTDGSCEVSGSDVSLIAVNSPIITSVVGTDPTSAFRLDGTITINAQYNSGPTVNHLQYTIDGGITWKSFLGTFLNLPAGTYQTGVRISNGTCVVMGPLVYLSEVYATLPPPPPNNFIAASDIYPNPAKNLFNINVNFEQEQDLEISIINSAGQIVRTEREQSIQRGILQFRVEDLPQGLYTVRIVGDEETQVHKLMIAR